MYDYAAIVRDFEAWLLEDGRQSHGTAHLTRRLAELRAEHRIDEGHDEATLRRFGTALLDDFIGRLPDEEDATTDPLTASDRCRCRMAGADPTEPGLRCVNARPFGCALEAPAAMDEGAATDHSPTEGASCLPKHLSARTPAVPQSRTRPLRSAIPRSASTPTPA